MSQNPIHLIQFSDTHLFDEPKGKLCGQNTEKSLDAVLTIAQKNDWPPDLILVTGDISQDTSESSYRRFQEKFSQLGAPVHCLPGNHDKPDVMNKILDKEPVQASRHVVKENWQFILLNSHIPNSNDGQLDPSELSFLDEVLNKNPKHHALVSFHHSPILVQSQWMDKMVLKNADALFSIVKKHDQVRGLLWGHIHQEFDGDQDGLKLMGSPSTCIQFRPQSDQFGFDAKPPGFRWLRLHEDGRIETGVERAIGFQVDVDFNSKGY